jgi:hypothetical protein
LKQQHQKSVFQTIFHADLLTEIFDLNQHVKIPVQITPAHQISYTKKHLAFLASAFFVPEWVVLARLCQLNDSVPAREAHPRLSSLPQIRQNVFRRFSGLKSRHSGQSGVSNLCRLRHRANCISTPFVPAWVFHDLA